MFGGLAGSHERGVANSVVIDLLDRLILLLLLPLRLDLLAVNVKLLLPPRQSRGTSHGC
jgi:hypothetical protein